MDVDTVWLDKNERAPEEPRVGACRSTVGSNTGDNAVLAASLEWDARHERSGAISVKDRPVGGGVGFAPDFSSTFGERLARERERLGFTQETFAQAAGVSPRSVTGYEGNRSMAPAETLLRFADLGVNVPYLLLGTYPNFDRPLFERGRRVVEQGGVDARGKPLQAGEIVLRIVSAYCWLVQAQSTEDAAERLKKIRADSRERSRDLSSEGRA